MKRLVYVMILLIVISFASSLYSLSKDFDLASTGGTGIIMYPSLDVSKSFEIGIGGQVVLLPDVVFSPALSIAFQGFNLGVAVDYSTSGGILPVIFSAKYQIASGIGIYGDLQWFTQVDDIAFSLMLLGGNGLFGLSIGGGWDLTFGFGMAFTPRYDWNLNVFFGVQKSVYADILFIRAELANYSYRIFYDPFFANDRRGVFNLGLNIVPAKWISIGVNGLDLLDANRSLALSFALRFNP
ncbi:MAG: hypothetical protein N2712_00030 [Brevinematales bacterium]|nr:hypothetical protein [Brevinematales bacterium]